MRLAFCLLNIVGVCFLASFGARASSPLDSTWLCKGEKASLVHIDGDAKAFPVDWQYVLDKDGFWPLGLPDDGKKMFALKPCGVQADAKGRQQIYCDGPNKFDSGY
jgi:hypothetical protein